LKSSLLFLLPLTYVHTSSVLCLFT
jgi:hypothetical protein